jgi:hypothetical protein
MGQVSSKLRRAENGYVRWCPACGEAHRLPDGWTFDGNLESPTFSPSFKHSGKQTVKDACGEWTGEWVLGPDGKALDWCCHYILTNGVLNYCGDCTHDMKGQAVPLPNLPEWMED